MPPRSHGIVLASIVAGTVLTPLSSARPASARLGLAAGLEWHSDWQSSVLGPTIAVTLLRPIGARFHLGGSLTASSRGAHGGDEVTLGPFDSVAPPRTDPIGGGIGGVVPTGSGEFFVEARALRILDADRLPRWLVPVRLGWRFDL